MTIPDWPEEFAELILLHVPALADSGPLDPQVPLRPAGLDSMGMIALLVDLETKFGFTFPVEEVTVQTFANPAALWAVVSRFATAT